MDYDGSWDNAVRLIEEREWEMPTEKHQLHCLCGQRVADEIELRVHQHYDHGATSATLAA